MIAALTPGESWTLLSGLLVACVPVAVAAVKVSAAVWKLTRRRRPNCCLICDEEDAWDGRYCRRCLFTLPNGEEQS